MIRCSLLASLQECQDYPGSSLKYSTRDADEETTPVARLSDYEIARRAQGVLFDTEYLHPQELHLALVTRLKTEFDLIEVSTQ